LSISAEIWEKQQLTTTEKRERHLILRWASARRYVSLILFLVLTLVFELLLIFAFQIMGLVDQNAWVSTLLIPGTSLSFTLTISPLLHLMPIAVIIVLFASWRFLSKANVFLPQHEIMRRVPPRRTTEPSRFKSIHRFFRNLGRRLQRFGRTVKSGFAKIPGASSISQRLSSAHAAVRSAIVILLVFISLAVGLMFVAYPDLIYYLTVNLYRSSPALVNCAAGTASWFNGVGTLLPPLGGLGAAINNALIAAAPGFRQSFEAAGTTLTRPIIELDVVGKFALSQNLAAYAAALIALMYGAYASTRRRRVMRR
jgi:hypothetical protein